MTRFLPVVAEQMAVVGAHRDFGVGAALVAAAALLAHQFGDERDEVDIAAEVVGLEERAVRLALDVAQMGEMDPRPEFARHGDEIVRRVRAERAGAERDAAGLRRHGGEQFAHVLGGRQHARQAEDREGRVVRMDGEARALLFRRLGDLAHEGDQVGAHLLDPDAGVTFEQVRKLARS